MKTQKLTFMSLAAAVAMILSYVESQIPAFVAVPGVKVGLANIAVVFVLYLFSWKEAAVISLVRVLAVSLLFGSIMSLFYSIAGAILSLSGMALMKRTNLFTCVSVSVAGGVLHNIGQIIMACIILETNVIKYYLPFLVLSGVIAGIVIGLASGMLVKRLDGIIKK